MGFKRLFFDIECSYEQGWFWRTAWNTSIQAHQIITPMQFICICWKWQGSDKKHYLKWDLGKDKEMIKAFLPILLDADEVVAHNGDRFDIPMFRTRCLLHGIKSIPEIKSIDTLKISRQKFKFKSNKLDEIAKELGIGSKNKTDIQLWHDVIQKNSKKAMKEMVEYCHQDVNLLEKVYLKLEGYAKPKTHIGISSIKTNKITSADRCSCPQCGSEKTKLNNRSVQASGNIVVRMLCTGCYKYFTVSLKTYNNR